MYLPGDDIPPKAVIMYLRAMAAYEEARKNPVDLK